MTDEKRKVKLLQDLSWHNSWVARLGSRVIGEGSLVVAVRMAVGMAIEDSICLVVCFIRSPIGCICTNTLLDSLSAERRSDSCKLSVGWDQVVRDILDEQALSLSSI